MDMDSSPLRIRDFAFLIAGVIDFILGLIFLLIWLGWLPFAQAILGVSHRFAGGLGIFLSITGIIVATYQLTKVKEPDQ
jgi:hypothetical protein